MLFLLILNLNSKIDEEALPVLYNLVENHFKTIEKLKNNRESYSRRFQSSLVPQQTVSNLVNKLSKQSNLREAVLDFDEAAYLISRMLLYKRKAHLSKKQRNKIKQSAEYLAKMKEYEEEAIKLAPHCQNRIICIENQEVNALTD
jgi:hypothetical protein